MANIKTRLGSGIFAAAVFMAGAVQHALAQPDLVYSPERCRALSDPQAQLRCFQDLLASSPLPARPKSSVVAGWRLVTTPNPLGGADGVSIMRTAVFSRSDPDFAGLMVRCAQPGAEVLVIVVRPLKPTARLSIKINAGGVETQFTPVVVPPFSAILLPKDSSTQAAGAWQSLSELSIEIDDLEANLPPIRGTVSMDGLRTAYQALLSTCPPP